MKAIFGILSLVIVLAVIGSIAKKQLFGSGVADTSLSGRASAAERAAALAGKTPATVSGIKAGLYGEILAKLREPIAT